MALALEERTVKALETIATSAAKTSAAMELIAKLLETKLEAIAEEVAEARSVIEKRGG
jgi:hypothetical protein